MHGCPCVMPAPQGFDANVAKRFREWQLVVDTVLIEPHIIPADQPAALKHALKQCQTLWVVNGHTAVLAKWQWTEAMAQAVAAAQPSLKHLNIVVHNKDTTLTDELLRLYASMGPLVRGWAVKKLHLTTSEHGATPHLPPQITIESIEAASLCHLPIPGAATEGEGEQPASGGVTINCARFGFGLIPEWREVGARVCRQATPSCMQAVTRLYPVISPWMHVR